MFIVRSAIWLGLAFVVMQPQDWDVGANAQALSDQAVNASKGAIATHVSKLECSNIQCAGGKALILASSIDQTSSQAVPPMQGSPRLSQPPSPRPRLARAG